VGHSNQLLAPAERWPGNPSFSLNYNPEIAHIPQPFGRKDFFFRVFMQRVEGTVWNRMFSHRLRHSVHRGGYLPQGWTDLYSSPHVWATQWSREDADIQYLAANSVDLDWYKIPELANKTHAEVHALVLDHCAAEGLPFPSAIVDTGRGSLLIWLYNRITTAKIMPRYREVNSELIKRFASFGADPACVNPRMWRVIGSMNSKTGRVVSIAWTFQDAKGKVAGYRFDDLAEAVLGVSREQQRAIYARIQENRDKARRRKEEAARAIAANEAKKAGAAVIPLDAHRMPVPADKERYNWLAEAEKDLVKLIREKHQGKLTEGDRDMFMFHLGCLMGQIYKADRWWSKLMAYAEEFLDEKFVRKRFTGYMSTLKKRVQQTTEGKRSRRAGGDQVSRVYTYSKARILRELNITEEDMIQYGLTALVSDDVREQHKYERRKEARRNAGAIERAVYEADSINRAKPWVALGISRATWYRKHRNEVRETVRQVCPTL
jgi:hypothetical protein